MSARKLVVIAAVAAWCGAAQAQARGSGGGGLSSTPPPTKSAGVDGERASLPARERGYDEPRRGVLGGRGAAPDAFGSSRLGARAPEASRPSYGEAAQGQGGGEVSETWKSGDRVRSWSSADVRAARQQEAPELEVATPSTRSGEAPAGAQPQQQYGRKFQEEQRKGARGR